MSTAIMLGTAATGATATTAATAATSGLFGTAGAFSFGQAMTTIGLGSMSLMQVGQGNVQAQAMKYNAKIQEQDALYTEDAAERNAAAEKRESSRQLDLLREQQRLERGSRIATQGASGLQLNGSPASVLMAQDWMDDQDAATLISGSRARQRNILYSAKNTASGYRAGAAGSRMSASNAVTSGNWSGFSTLAMGGKYYA